MSFVRIKKWYKNIEFMTGIKKKQEKNNDLSGHVGKKRTTSLKAKKNINLFILIIL